MYIYIYKCKVSYVDPCMHVYIDIIVELRIYVHSYHTYTMYNTSTYV